MGLPPGLFYGFMPPKARAVRRRRERIGNRKKIGAS
jgi:hypothetical protein